MRKNLAALYTNGLCSRKNPEQHHVTQKKSTVNKIRNRQFKKSSRNKIHLNTLELKHAVNHCDVKNRRVSYKSKCERKDFFRKQPRYKKQVQSLGRFIFTNNIITAEQSNNLQQLYLYENHSYNASLLIRDSRKCQISGYRRLQALCFVGY